MEIQIFSPSLTEQFCFDNFQLLTLDISLINYCSYLGNLNMLSTLHESILTFSPNLVSKASCRKAVARVASGRGIMRRSACYWEVDLPQGFEGMEYPSTRPSLEPPPESFENWTPKNVNYIILNKSLLNI